MPHIFRKAAAAIFLLLFYSVIFFLYTAPLWNNFSEGFIGENTGNSDANQYVWNAYNFRKSVLTGENPFFTNLMLHPKGSWLFFHTYTPIIGILHLLIPDNLTAVNGALWLSFVLSGVGAYLFCIHFVKNRILSITAGLIFSFCPYKTAHLPEHYHLMLTATIPFFALFFIKSFVFTPKNIFFSVASWRYVAGCLVLGIISFLSDYYSLFFLLYYSGGYYAYQVYLQHINWKSRQTWIFILGIFIGSNILLRLLKLLQIDDKGGFWWGADVVSYFVPPAHLKFVSGHFSDKFYKNADFFNMPGSVENIVFPGFTLLCLTLSAFIIFNKVRFNEKVKPLLFLTALFFMMTLPTFQVLGKGFFKMPTALLHYIPLLNNIRCPTRIVVMLMLFLPMVCFFILNAYLRQSQSNRVTVGVSVLILILVIVEFQPKTQAMILKKDVPSAYLAATEMNGEVLFSFPFGLRDGMNKKGEIVLNDLFYQTLHHKRMPGAYISRIDKTTFTNFDNNPVMQNLLGLQLDSAFSIKPLSESAIQNFKKTYHPDIYIISPILSQHKIASYLTSIYPGAALQRSKYGKYIVLKVNKAETEPVK